MRNLIKTLKRFLNCTLGLEWCVHLERSMGPLDEPSQRGLVKTWFRKIVRKWKQREWLTVAEERGILWGCDGRDLMPSHLESVGSISSVAHTASCVALHSLILFDEGNWLSWWNVPWSEYMGLRGRTCPLGELTRSKLFFPLSPSHLFLNQRKNSPGSTKASKGTLQGLKRWETVCKWAF